MKLHQKCSKTSGSILFKILSLERCPSGRRSTPGKCVNVKSVSGVRIPFSPLKKRSLGAFFVYKNIVSTDKKKAKRRIQMKEEKVHGQGFSDL